MRSTRLSAQEGLLAVLVVACPPLLAFGVYFAVWHSLRQTVRLLVIHPDAARRLTRDGVPAAAGLLVRQAALPTLTAAAGLLVIGLHQHGASATVLVGLLAISVPHTIRFRDRRGRRASTAGVVWPRPQAVPVRNALSAPFASTSTAKPFARAPRSRSLRAATCCARADGVRTCDLPWRGPRELVRAV